MDNWQCDHAQSSNDLDYEIVRTAQMAQMIADDCRVYLNEKSTVSPSPSKSNNPTEADLAELRKVKGNSFLYAIYLSNLIGFSAVAAKERARERQKRKERQEKRNRQKLREEWKRENKEAKENIIKADNKTSVDINDRTNVFVNHEKKEKKPKKDDWSRGFVV